MAKSQNKHNRIYVIVEPMDEKFVEEIDNKNTRASDDLKVISRLLIDKYELAHMTLKKLWVFCPDHYNFLVYQTKTVKYLKEILDSMEFSFQKVKNNEV
jgi:elongation factor 2